MTSYDYQRSLDSHMMKNTEWGSVAYLSHSKYGQGNKNIRINNKGHKTGYAATTEDSSEGWETSAWNTTTGYLASTTGNITGVYDMSGGAWEHVMGVLVYSNGLPLSGRHNIHTSGFNGKLGNPNYGGGDSSITEITNGIPFPDKKYYDTYPANSSGNGANRILGDATGEMGPFGGGASSWHSDRATFISSSGPWFYRSGYYDDGSRAGVFNFGSGSGGDYANTSFRIVLAP